MAVAARVSTKVEALEDVDVECTHCGIKMTSHQGSGGRIRYFRCASCHRWVSSTYADIFRADAKVRTRPRTEDEKERAFGQVKERLERFLTAIDDQDPFRVLGVSPHASMQIVRERYRELAFRSHPDRAGGSEGRMRELNLAYERILAHHERREAERAAEASRMESGTETRTAQAVRLPARSR